MNKHELRVLNDIVVLLERSVRFETNEDIRQEYKETLAEYRIILDTLNNRRKV